MSSKQPGEIAFPLGDIPVKLRCTLCSKLARDALRLPCCEQSICGTCHASLPDKCPICDHAPLDASLCKPNNALRTTVAVFLRTAEKKYLLSQKKESAAVPTPPPGNQGVLGKEDGSTGPESMLEGRPMKEGSESEVAGGPGISEIGPQREANMTQPSQDAESKASHANSSNDGNAPTSSVEPPIDTAALAQEQGQQFMENHQHSQQYSGSTYDGYQDWSNVQKQNISASNYAQTVGDWNVPNSMDNMNVMQGMQGSFPLYTGNGVNGTVGLGMGVGFHGNMSGPGFGGWNDGLNAGNGMGNAFDASGMMNNTFFNGVGGYNHHNFGNHQMPYQHHHQYQNFGYQGNGSLSNHHHHHPHHNHHHHHPPHRPNIPSGFMGNHKSDQQERPFTTQTIPGYPINHEDDASLQNMQGQQRRSNDDDNAVKVLTPVVTDDQIDVDGQVKEVVASSDDKLGEEVMIPDITESDARLPTASSVNGIIESPLHEGNKMHQQTQLYSRGGYTSRGNNGYRGNYRGGFTQSGAQHDHISQEHELRPPMAPEGAPTGPKAMRERGRGRGRGTMLVSPSRGGYNGISAEQNNMHLRTRSITDTRSVDDDNTSRSFLAKTGSQDGPYKTNSSENLYAKADQGRLSRPSSPRARSAEASRSRSPKRKKHKQSSSRRISRSRSQSRDKEKDRDRDRDRSRERNSDRKKDREREKDRSSRHSRKHRHKSPSDRSKRKSEAGLDRMDPNTSRDPSRERERGKPRDKNKTHDRTRESNKVDEADKETGRTRERDRARDRSRDKDKDKERRQRKRSRSHHRSHNHHKRSKHDQDISIEDEDTNPHSKPDRKSSSTKEPYDSRSSRKHSYKYDDDDEATAAYERRIEREREEERWGKR